MSGQQIDSLTVGVGLTQEDFQAGVQRILGSLEGLKTETTGVGKSMTSSLAGVGSSVLRLGLKFAGLFLAVRGIEDVVGYFKDLSSELTNLSYSSEYLGQTVPTLARFGEVAKLAGGQVQDAISGIQGLQSSIFGLEFQGQMSQNLLMLQRLGVAYLDSAGHMRSMKDIAFDTAAALERQLPGKANETMRVQWAASIFGAGGIANAVGGGLAELRTFYAHAAAETKNITQKAADAQRQMQQNITELSYTIKNDAVKALNDLTPKINDLIKVIRDRLVPTIDEAIGDLVSFMHPGNAADDAMNGNGVGPLGFKHPLNTFKAIGIGLGIRAGQFREWWEKNLGEGQLAGIEVPVDVSSRLAPGTNMDALKMLHIEAGGDTGDPTWSRAVSTYGGMSKTPGAVTIYLQSALATGVASPSAFPNAAHLSTPSARRPAATAGASKPTASTGGPRVQIGSIGPIYTQATDANGLVAGINAAAQRKLLVAQADPGLA